MNKAGANRRKFLLMGYVILVIGACTLLLNLTNVLCLLYPVFHSSCFSHKSTEKLTTVKILWKYGFVNSEGRFIIHPAYDFAFNFTEGFAAVCVHGEWGYIDKQGRIVIGGEFSDARPFSEGLAAVALDNEYGFIDKTGNFVIAPDYSYTSSFRDGLAVVSKQGKYGFIDKSGNEVIPLQYTDVRPFSEDLAAAQVLKVISVKKAPGSLSKTSVTNTFQKWGYIDKAGEMVIQPQFAWVQDFSEDCAAVQIENGGKWGYIDKTGTLVIPAQYNEACSFLDGAALVHTDSGNHLIDTQGEQIHSRPHQKQTDMKR